MEPSDRLIQYAIKVAVRTARVSNLDVDVAVSIACEHALTQARRVKTESECFKLLATVLQRRLVCDILDEIRVFGPSSITRLQQKRRNQRKQFSSKRESTDVIPYISRPSKFNMVDFLDQFQGNDDLLQLVTLMLAGYNQSELIQQFGYKRAQLAHLRERLEHVLTQD